MVEKLRLLKTTNPGLTFSRTDDPDHLDDADERIGLLGGAIIGGVYEIIEPIGRGGMGEVYLVRHLGLGNKCALKVIPPTQVQEKGWQRFQIEAKIVAGLTHKNLVRVTDLGIHDGCLPYYAMDYVAGKTLAEELLAHGPFPVEKMLDVFLQVCDCLQYAHDHGIIHRDLKPANVIISSQGHETNTVKILDFGLAKLSGDSREIQSLTAVGDVFGSPFYMSPEQCDGQTVDARSDIYSLGCTIFECLTGRPPFTGHLAAAIMFSHLEAMPPSLASASSQSEQTKFTPALQAVVAKMLRKNPDERYASMSELRADLLRLQKGESDFVPSGTVVAARSPATAPQVRPQPLPKTIENPDAKPAYEKHGRFVIIAGAITALLSSIAVFFLVQERPPARKLSNSARAALSMAQSLSDSADHVDAAAAGDPLRKPTGPPFSHIESVVDGDGRTIAMRIFDFPEKSSLGLIYNHQKEKVDQARGRVSFAADDQLTFAPQAQASDGRYCYARFQRGDIHALQLRNVSALTLLAATEIPGVKSLSLEYSPGIGDNCVPFLTKFKELEILKLADVQVSGETLSTLPGLKHLQKLAFNACPDPDSLAHALEGSKLLTELSLRDVQLSLAGFRSVAAIENLRTFNVFAEPLSDDKLRALAHCKNLEFLNVNDSRIEPGQIAILRKFPKLKHLRMGDASPRVLALFLRQLPGVKIETMANASDKEDSPGNEKVFFEQF
jgi:serine/threonine protein kinase